MRVGFLCLAALYESWSVPTVVMLMAPLGVFGAALAAYGRGLSNDVYFQVGLLTTIGLSAKNAIRIVEFAKRMFGKGKDLHAAIVEAVRLRLRPIRIRTPVGGQMPLTGRKHPRPGEKAATTATSRT
jgi:multidrug efflux pump